MVVKDRTAYHREWYACHIDSERQRKRERYERVRESLLEVLGPFCKLCGETDTGVLVFDHTAPIGHKSHRYAYGNAERLKLNLLRGKENPFNLQVLCANDHTRKTRDERAAGYDKFEISTF